MFATLGIPVAAFERGAVGGEQGWAPACEERAQQVKDGTLWTCWIILALSLMVLILLAQRQVVRDET